MQKPGQQETPMPQHDPQSSTPSTRQPSHHETGEALARESGTVSPKQTSYVSPSDAIMSPASKKLSSFKQRQIAKQGARATDGKPRSLFQRAITTATREKDLGPE